jgi:aryl-phospho-beta-D-glucosidase BglC (GH1 family)
MYNADVVKWLKNDWKSTLVRVALGADESGSYLEDPKGNVARIEAVVDAAIANDLYVIIDFHSHHAEDKKAEAIAFFERMAQSLRDKAQTAMNNGVAQIVTEWGTVNASGDGTVSEAANNEWMAFLKKHNLTHLNWAVSDKSEGASIIRPVASPSGGWAASDLTASGA